jgi:hypothetical protein
MDALSRIYESLKHFSVAEKIALISYGGWGIEFHAESPLSEPEMHELAVCLSGNEHWSDLSWAKPISANFKLKSC